MWRNFGLLRILRDDLHRKRCQSSSSFARPLRVLFYGSDHFSLATLKVLAQEWKRSDCSGLSELAVVTGIKRPPNPVHVYSEEQSIPFHSWPTGNDGAFDIGVVVSFSHLIPQRIITSFPLGMINLHSSLLPRWRGAAPIIYSLKAGDPVTGVTVMKVEPKHYDVGNIILQQKVPIDRNVLLPTLHNHLAGVGADLMLQSLSNIHQLLNQSTKQPAHGVTYAPKVEGHALSYIDWERMAAREVFNLFRALYGFRPVLTEFHGNVVKLTDMEVLLEDSLFEAHHPRGFFIFDRTNNRLVVNCADGSTLSVRGLQVIGKKPMTAIQFINGFVKKRPLGEWVFTNKVVDQIQR